MKTILTATALLALAVAPAAAQDVRGIQAQLSEKTQPVLNGSLDLGADTQISPAAIVGEIDVDSLSGETTVEITDQIDSVTGRVSAVSTAVTDQVNNGPISAAAEVGVNAANRSADITAAAIGNSLSIVNGISQ